MYSTKKTPKMRKHKQSRRRRRSLFISSTNHTKYNKNTTKKNNTNNKKKKQQQTTKPKMFTQLNCSPFVIKNNASSASSVVVTDSSNNNNKSNSILDSLFSVFGGKNHIQHSSYSSSPSSFFSPKSCVPKEAVLNLAKTWNSKNKTNKIMNTNYDNVYEDLKHKLSNVCSNEKCWFKQLGSSSSYNTNYAPNMPESSKKTNRWWLSNIDILKILHQYEETYPFFKLLGPSPIDFDTKIDNICVEDSLCNLNLNTYMKKGITKIGIVFNTDTHDQGGSHWISLFINIPNKTIFFFDSAGDICPSEIMSLVSRLKKQGLKESVPMVFTFDQNYPKVHQLTTSECGMYSLFFIINMITDTLTNEQLKTKTIPDKVMVNLRNKYFNPLET